LQLIIKTFSPVCCLITPEHLHLLITI
jgi:hypothetical protein